MRGCYASGEIPGLNAAPPHPRAQEIVYDFLSSRAPLPWERERELERASASGRRGGRRPVGKIKFENPSGRIRRGGFELAGDIVQLTEHSLAVGAEGLCLQAR